MPFRVKFRFVIDDNSKEVIDLLNDMVELNKLDGYLHRCRKEMHMIDAFVDGLGITFDEMEYCSSPKFADNIIAAAKASDLPRGDMKMVTDGVEMLQDLFKEKILVDKQETLLLEHWRYYGASRRSI